MPPGRTGRLSLIHLTSGLGWTETLDRIGRRDFQFHLSVRQQLNGDPLVGDHLLAVLAPLDLRQKTCGRRLAPTFAVNFSGDWEFVAQKFGRLAGQSQFSYGRRFSYNASCLPPFTKRNKKTIMTTIKTLAKLDAHTST